MTLKRVAVVPDGPVYQRKGYIVREYVAKKRADGAWTWRAGDVLHSVASEIRAKALALDYAKDTGVLYSTSVRHGTLLAAEEVLLTGPTLAEQFGGGPEPVNHPANPYTRFSGTVACWSCITNHATTPSVAVAIAPRPVGNRRDTAEWIPLCANHLERWREDYPTETLPIFGLLGSVAYVPTPDATDPDPFAFTGGDP